MSPISSKVYGGWHQTVRLPVFGSSWDASSSAQGQNRALTEWYWNTEICETDRISVISDPGCMANRWCCLLFRAIFRKCAATLRKYPIWNISIFENIIVVIIERVGPIFFFMKRKNTWFFIILLHFKRFPRVFYSQNDVFRRFEVFYQHCLPEAVSGAMSHFGTYQFQTHNHICSSDIWETKPSESQIIPNSRP